MSDVALAAGGPVLAVYRDGTRMDPQDSPRPYLDEVRSLAGVVLTETETADHRHHYGISLALPDVDGTSHWGGRTFVGGSGSTMLDNHGRQVVVERSERPSGVTERVDLQDPSGRVRLRDERELAVTSDAAGWRLDWRSRLRAVGGEVSLGSPQTNGRDGAFYGGLFWRTPFAAARALVAEGAGTDLAHGSTSPWLAVTTAECTIIARTSTGMPWFVRTEGYVGFGPAVAVEGRRVVPEGESLLLDLTALVVDEGDMGHARAAELAEGLQ